MNADIQGNLAHALTAFGDEFNHFNLKFAACAIRFFWTVNPI